MRFTILAFVLASSIADAALLKRDVPLGECHSCEAFCFEDCTAQFYQEVIQADRREYELKQRMLRKHGGGNLAARGLAGVTAASFAQAAPEAKNQADAVASFSECLDKDSCGSHTAPAAKCKLSMLAKGVKAGKQQEKCLAAEQPCAQNCVDKVVGLKVEKAVVTKNTTLLQKGFPHAPVDRGAFGEGRMTLDFCFKSCLAVTCGCSDAPGFAKIAKMTNQIRSNDEALEPVQDTPPSWQYRPASNEQCAGGIPGKKVNKGLYNNYGGNYVEVCTQGAMDAFFGPAYPGSAEQLKKCKSRALEDTNYGCSMKDGKCLAMSNVPNMPCFERFKRDKSL